MAKKKRKRNRNIAPHNDFSKIITSKDYIDMHVHTIRSLDGGFAVSKILNHSLANNIKHLSITDHNTLKGVKKAQNIIKNNPEKFKDLNLIPGVEISCVDETLGVKFHLLAYGFDVNNKALNDKLNEIQKAERQRYYALFALMEHNFGIKFSPYEIVKASATNNDITWDVVAKMAVLHIDENGRPAPYAATPEEFLEKVKIISSTNKKLSKKKSQLMLDIKRLTLDDISAAPYPSLDDILPLIKDAGGIPVLAHPTLINFSNKDNQDTNSELDSDKETEKLTATETPSKRALLRQKQEEFIKNFKGKTDKLGMEAGLEILFSAQKNTEDYYLDIAKKYNLLISGGSDFHGPHKNLTHRIGSVKGKYQITSLTLLDYLNNGRDITQITNPKSAKSCYETITTKLVDKIVSKNESIVDKRKIKQVGSLQIIKERFGKAPLHIHKLESRVKQMRLRETLYQTITILKKDMLGSGPDGLSIDDIDNKKLQKLKSKLPNTLRRYNIRINDIKKCLNEFYTNDTLENKEKFGELINKELNQILDKYHSLEKLEKELSNASNKSDNVVEVLFNNN